MGIIIMHRQYRLAHGCRALTVSSENKGRRNSTVFKTRGGPKMTKRDNSFSVE